MTYMQPAGSQIFLSRPPDQRPCLLRRSSLSRKNIKYGFRLPAVRLQLFCETLLFLFRKDCLCIFRIYTEKYFCHYFLSFLFFCYLHLSAERFLTKHTADIALRFAGSLTPYIFFLYKPHSLRRLMTFLPA